MQRDERVTDDGVAAHVADDVVELVVHLTQVLSVALFKVKLLQVHDVAQAREALGRSVFRRVVGREPLDLAADIHDVHQILGRDAEHDGAFAGVGDEVLLLEAAQRLADGRAADVELLDEPELREHLAARVHTLNDIGFQPLKHLIGQRNGTEIFHAAPPVRPARSGRGPALRSWR